MAVAKPRSLEAYWIVYSAGAATAEPDVIQLSITSMAWSWTNMTNHQFVHFATAADHRRKIIFSRDIVFIHSLQSWAGAGAGVFIYFIFRVQILPWPLMTLYSFLFACRVRVQLTLSRSSGLCAWKSGATISIGGTSYTLQSHRRR